MFFVDVDFEYAESAFSVPECLVEELCSSSDGFFFFFCDVVFVVSVVVVALHDAVDVHDEFFFSCGVVVFCVVVFSSSCYVF